MGEDVQSLTDHQKLLVEFANQQILNQEAVSIAMLATESDRVRVLKTQGIAEVLDIYPILRVKSQVS